MIELRLAISVEGGLQLQQRTRTVVTDASGAFCGFSDWSEWTAVSLVKAPHRYAE